MHTVFSFPATLTTLYGSKITRPGMSFPSFSPLPLFAVDGTHYNTPYHTHCLFSEILVYGPKFLYFAY